MQQEYQQRVREIKTDADTGKTLTTESLPLHSIPGIMYALKSARYLRDTSLERIDIEKNADALVTPETHEMGELFYEHEVIPSQSKEAAAQQRYDEIINVWKAFQERLKNEA
ncbi:hypothetical protein KDI_50400 [Dictyobacter arantiisoli]|uniref:Uncharacterized protein n=1 Tax=Dictyobacter arantiisoli TaxID=2014874 RepID=A0A5A5TK72_9CHLR|nr:hypothetical protein KDI_50400 [Dictyobacter arantiisoli]